MAAPTIYVLRHAEKPAEAKNRSLSEEGQERALKLADWFPKEFGQPDIIIASQPTKHSQRPYETVQPLANNVGMIIDMRYEDEEYDKLATRMLCHSSFDGKTVVVCWHHGKIPHLMHELGANSGQYPKPWKDDVFDIILKVVYDAKGNAHVKTIKMEFETEEA